MIALNVKNGKIATVESTGGAPDKTYIYLYYTEDIISIPDISIDISSIASDLEEIEGAIGSDDEGNLVSVEDRIKDEVVDVGYSKVITIVEYIYTIGDEVFKFTEKDIVDGKIPECIESKNGVKLSTIIDKSTTLLDVAENLATTAKGIKRTVSIKEKLNHWIVIILLLLKILKLNNYSINI